MKKIAVIGVLGLLSAAAPMQQEAWGLTQDAAIQEDTSCEEHVYGEWIITQEADCTHEGKAKRVCQKCGDIQNGVIKKTPHTKGELKVIKEPSCNEAGIGERSCSVCQEVYQKEVIPAQAHETGDWVITRSPGFLTEGIREKSCKKCQAVMEREKIPANYTLTETITLNQSQINTTAGQLIYLSAVTEPEMAENQQLVWSTSDPSVAVVDQNGMVYTTGMGEAYITATAFDGVSSVCKICTGFSIFYVLNGGENSSNNQIAFYEPSDVTLYSPSKKGYLFDGWYTNANGEGSPVKKLQNRSSYVLYAKWTKAQKPDKVANVMLYSTGDGGMYLECSSYKEPVYYQIVLAENEKFTKEKKVKESTYPSAVVEGLQKGTTYYVKVRAYQKDSKGGRYYGAYSSVRKITIK